MTRPDDIGVSVSYPLPDTRFYAKVQAELGHKRNWIDSDDLCVMFKAAYTNEFYRAVRDALHAEVDSWHTIPSSEGECDQVDELWRKVAELEPLTRNADPTTFWLDNSEPLIARRSQYVPLQHLSHAMRDR
jgi:hypothetical protein